MSQILIMESHLVGECLVNSQGIVDVDLTRGGIHVEEIRGWEVPDYLVLDGTLKHRSKVKSREVRMTDRQ